MVVVSFSLDIEVDAESKGGDKTNKTKNMLEFVEEVVTAVMVLSTVAHKRVQGKKRTAGLLGLLTGLSELVSLLSQNRHSDVMSSTHRLLRRNFATLELLGDLDDGIVTELHIGLRCLNVARFGKINEHIVSTTLVVGRALIIVRCRVVLCLKLVLSACNSLNGFNRVSSVGSSHHLEKRCSSNKSGEDGDLLDGGANGFNIVLLGSLNTRLSFGDNETPNSNRDSAECLAVASVLDLSRGTESVASATEVLLFVLIALNPVHVALVDHVAQAHVSKHDKADDQEDLRALVKAVLVVASLLLVILDVLKELNRVLRMVKILFLDNAPHVLLLLFVVAAAVSVASTTVTVTGEFEKLHSFNQRK